MLCYVTYFSLLLLEVLEGIPGLISHPWVKLGVCASVMVCSCGDETFFLVPSYFFLFLFLKIKSASLWLKVKLESVLSTKKKKQRWPCDEAWMSVCLLAFSVAQKWKTVKQKSCLQTHSHSKWSWHVEIWWKDNLIISISNSSFFSSYPEFTLNPSAILSYLPSSVLLLHPFFFYFPFLKHFPWCFIQSCFIFLLSLHEFPIQLRPSFIATCYVLSLFHYASIYPSSIDPPGYSSISL